MPNPYAAKRKNRGAVDSTADDITEQKALNPWSKSDGTGTAKPNAWSPNRRNGKPAPTVPKTLGALLGQKKRAQKPLPQKQCKEDFYHAGVLFWDAKITDGVNDIGFDPKIVVPRGTVSVSNGDETYVFHNRYGSWMADVGAEGRMAEPAWVANALGTNMGQVEMFRNIVSRFENELKKQGVLTRDQQRILLEKAAEEARRKEREAAAKAKEEKVSPKKTNPYAKKVKK